MSSPCVGNLLITADAPIREAIAAIDYSRKLGVALVVDEQQRLVNTITDGDVRRGLIRGLSLERPVSELLAIKSTTPHPVPVVANCATSKSDRFCIMKENNVRQLPVLDDQGRVIEVELLSEFLDHPDLPFKALVMAGGRGKRLLPLTEAMPKPMLPVGGRPVMEHLVRQLSDAGIRQVDISVHYLPERIVEHFKDGSEFGVNIQYMQEENALGTAGALGLMPRPDTDVLVVNGDIVTQVDFVSMLDYHMEHRAVMTVAVRSYEHAVPYGVVELNDADVACIREKPRQSWFVNAGIYVVGCKAFDYIRPGEPLDMPSLIERLLAAKKKVVGFPIREKWMDIGQLADYERARKEADDPASADITC